jgi:hypothetical protein
VNEEEERVKRMMAVGKGTHSVVVTLIYMENCTLLLSPQATNHRMNPLHMESCALLLSPHITREEERVKRMIGVG